MTSPEVDFSDTAELSDEDSERSRCGRCRRWMKRDWFFVELVLTAHSFCQFPMNAASQLYVLDWISTNVYNSTADESWEPNYIASPCDPNVTDYELQLSNRAQTLTSLFLIVECFAWGIPALIVTILLGSGSDRLGRRFAILPPLLGIITNGVVTYLVIRTSSAIVYFLIGDFLYGCCGSLSAITMACFSYVAERTPPEKRMLRITLLQLCLLVSGMLTGIVIGQLMSAVGKDNTVLITLCIAIVNCAYVYVFLRDNGRKVGQEPVVTEDQSNVHGPSRIYDDGRARLVGHDMPSVTDLDTSGYAFESTTNGDDVAGSPRFRHVGGRSIDDPADVDARPEVEKSRIELDTRQLCAGMLRAAKLFLYPGPHRFRLNALMAAFFFSVLCTAYSLQTLFEMNQPLCWSVGDIGTFMGVTLAISALGAGIVMPLMRKCATDWHIAMTATVTAVVTNVYKFFVRNTLMMYLSSSLAMFTVLQPASIRSIMSVLVPVNDQGALFGSIATVDVFGTMLSTLIFNTIYSQTLDVASTFFFLVIAAFYFVACIFLLVYYVRVKQESRRQQLRLDASEPA